MKTSVYIESSVISYLTARPSRDLVKSARQAITSDWWEQDLPGHSAFISLLVEREISQGHPDAAQKRLDAVADFESLSITLEASQIADALLQSGCIPAGSSADALHIGIAAANGIEFLITWNFKHINNAYTRERINQLISSLGYVAATLCSPEELVQQR